MVQMMTDTIRKCRMTLTDEEDMVLYRQNSMMVQYSGKIERKAPSVGWERDGIIWC